jgi:hypothetical protein
VTPHLTAPMWRTLREVCSEPNVTTVLRYGTRAAAEKLVAMGLLSSATCYGIRGWIGNDAGRAALAEHDKARERDV